MPRLPRLSLTVSTALLLLAAGTGPQPLRAATAGVLDLSFQGTGWTTLSSAFAGSAQDLAVLPDGRMLLGGFTADDVTGIPPILTFWRVLPDGSPDPTFNFTGMTRIQVEEAVGGGGMAVRPDGGFFTLTKSQNVTLLVSLLPDGRLDTSFGREGRGFARLWWPAGFLSRLLLQPDGKILMSDGNSNAVVRYFPDGEPDQMFGQSNGVSAVPGISGTLGLALQPDGKIVLCHTSPRFQLSRLLSNGVPDSSFGQDGLVTDTLTDMQAAVIRVGADGSILVGGQYFTNSERGFMVARLLPDGALDTTFGGSGTGFGKISFGPVISYLAAMTVQSDGHILLAGITRTGVLNFTDIALARFTADGLPDPSFGSGGQVHTDLGGTANGVAACVLQTDSKLVLAGGYSTVEQPYVARALLTRYHVGTDFSLRLEHPGGTLLPQFPPRLDFGTATVPVRIEEVVLLNDGPATLTNIQVTLFDASHPGEFHVALPPAAATLAPGARASMTVSFTPSAAPGPRTASLRLTAAEGTLPPRVISLTGSKATPLEIWRLTWFGSPLNSGLGADTNDFDADGLPNFMEYATASHPHQPSPSPLRLSPDTPGAFTFTRPSAALTEFSWQPESAPSPEGPWSSGGLTTTVLTDDGTLQTIQVTPAAETPPSRLFLRLRITKQ